MSRLLILIPAYEPDAKLIALLDQIRSSNPSQNVLVVDDGSGPGFRRVFDEAEARGAVVISQPENRGKGFALKQGFAYAREHFPDQVVVCADCDGQHSYSDIVLVGREAERHPLSMVLGVRDFASNVPLRSRVGNVATKGLFRLGTGVQLRDTQTGLRGYPGALLPWLGSVGGERFDYELRLLLDAKGSGVGIVEVPTATIYLEGNASSHFRPIVDSARIYAPLLRFIVSSIGRMRLPSRNGSRSGHTAPSTRIRRLGLVVATACVALAPLWIGVNSSATAAKRTKGTSQPTTTTPTRPTSTKTPIPGAATSAPTAWRTLDVSSKGLKEVSGCAYSRKMANRVWVHNDSGDGPLVVPVDVATGAVGRSVTLAGIDVVDPEDIAITPNGDLILADIGDNAENRSSIQLYRFAEPARDATSASPRRLDLRYPDGPHNAEALAVAADGSTALIITKDETGVADVFRADLTAAASQVLTRVGQVTIRGETGYKANMISAADALGPNLLIRSFQNGYLLVSPTSRNVVDAISSAPRRFAVPQMAQGEALCVSPDGLTLVTASESQGAPTFSMAVGPVPR